MKKSILIGLLMLLIVSLMLINLNTENFDVLKKTYNVADNKEVVVGAVFGEEAGVLTFEEARELNLDLER